ncbi:hypothetical protein QYE76_042233 [Lolium multiflorum]|uniref:Retrotransposon gag domain-containing protein n=1 Tax=Lolium multiflorum TaxID=4521 RepID=A0AAD8TEZ8_LOLMU|nr:hypothetical protein QYE76_042233 [Lolium multiflorum]
MTNAEMHAHFTHLLGGHATDVDGRLGDVDAKLTDALDKIDGLEAYYQELQTCMIRCGIVEDNEAMLARFFGGLNKEIQHILDYKEYNTITRLFHLACKAEREVQDRQPPWRRANISAGRTSSWSPRQSAPPSRGATSAPTTSKYTAPASRAPPAATPPPSAGPPRSSSSMASTGKTRDTQCRKCLGFGHIERECRTKRVMLVREDGEYDSASDFDEDTLALIAARDGANSDSERDGETIKEQYLHDADFKDVDEDIPTSLLPPSLPVEDDPAVKLKSNEVRIGPITRAHAKLLKQQKKDPSLPVTWMEYEALRDHLTRELRVTTETFDTEIQGVNLKVDEAITAINTVQTSMTTLQASIHNLTQAVGDIRTVVQQPLDEDGSVNGDNADVAAAQGVVWSWSWTWRWTCVRRTWVRVPPQPQDDGLGKLKFSIPRFEGTTDVEEYLTWELKIERLWRLHDYTEDRKIKLASFEFDGYALRWWDGLVRAREEDGELPIITWRTMKAAMRARFVPTNYLRLVFDKLTKLKQGVMTVDTYYMEIEMLMQRARVSESLEMTLQRFLNGLKFNIKGIVRHHSYTAVNEVLHHAREAESQLAEEAQQRGCATGAGRYTPRPPPSTAPSMRPTDVPYSSSKPVSNVSHTKKPAPAASGTSSNQGKVARYNKITWV